MNTKLSLAVIAATLAASPAAMAQTTGNNYQNNASESGYERSSPSGLPTTSPQVRSLPGEQPDPWSGGNRAVGTQSMGAQTMDTQSWNSPSRATSGSSMGPNDRMPAYGNTYGTPANPSGQRAVTGSTAGTGTMGAYDRAPAYGNTYGTESNQRAMSGSSAMPGDLGPNDRSPAYGNTYGTPTNPGTPRSTYGSNSYDSGSYGSTTPGTTMTNPSGTMGSTGAAATGAMGSTGSMQGNRQVLMNVDRNVGDRAGRGQNRTELMQTSLLNYFSSAGFTAVRDFRKQGQNYVAEAQDQDGRWTTVELDPRTGTITSLR